MSKAEIIFERLQTLPETAQTALMEIVDLLAPGDARSSANAPGSTTLGRQFRDLSNAWRHETRFLSFMEQRAMHSAYQRIIGMGWVAVPLILRELDRQPEHWLWALRAITGADPAALAEDLPSAAKAWVAWGRDKGLLADGC